MVLINGEPGDTINVADRGFGYGDGLFETAAVEGGEPLLWGLHMERLVAGCRRLGIPAPEPERVQEEVERLCREGKRGVLKLIVTRGVGGRGYLPPEHAAPTRVMAFHPVPDYPERLWREGIALHLCTTPLGCNPALAGLKHLNRLEQVVARSEWRDGEVHEGVMRDLEGNVVEGVISNLFAVVDGNLVTPDLSRCGVAGVVRRHLLERSAGAVQVRPLSLDELLAADELFVTNGVIGLWPVARLGERRWWAPGEATMTMMNILREAGFRVP